ncbi:MAG: condensation protein [Sphingobacteriaceae bacterium]|nr:MAG: condensation protein [Sphingobacteriaceae bacterium]
MTNQQNRTLGAFEKTFWLLDQIDSKDFALAAEINGRETVEAWQQALVKLQQRHPNLSAKVVLDQFSRPVLKHVEGTTIPLRVLNVEDNYRWEQEAEKELATRFNTTEAPLLRAVLIQKPTTTVLILASSHVVADGTSITYLFRDILNALTGKELQAMKPQQSNDETLGLPEDIVIADAEHVKAISNNFKEVAPKISSIRMDAATTQRLIEKAREEGTTVHGAICAAVLTTSRAIRTEWSDRKIELISPICARGPLKLDDNYGLNITTHPVYFEGEQQYDFWEIARQAKAGLAGTNTEEHVRNYINFFRDLTFNSTDIQKMIDILKNAFNHEIMVTNLGKLKYDTDFGKLKLNAVYGPIVRSGKGMEQTVGAISCNNALCLTNTSDSPITCLLEAIMENLTEACSLDQHIAV